jgi:hypothetical protein
VTALFDQELRPYGLNSKQFSLLVMILQRDLLAAQSWGRENHQIAPRSAQPAAADLARLGG